MIKNSTTVMKTSSIVYEELIPLYQHCKKCNEIIIIKRIIQEHLFFYCNLCRTKTLWSYKTGLQTSKLTISQIEKLICIFLEHIAAGTAGKIVNLPFFDGQIHENTVRTYFLRFCEATLDHYDEVLNSTLLKGEIELDETYLFRPKPSSAPSRGYKNKAIWLFGLKQRGSNSFIIIPLKDRSEETIVPLIRRFVKIGSVIYTDEFSVYVNNYSKQSKLTKYQFAYLHVNHKRKFVSEIFSQVHTNSIEELWREVKFELKTTRTTSKYMLLISRFIFHKTLSYDDQARKLVSNLKMIR